MDKEILEFIKANKKEVLEALGIKKEIKMIKKLRKFLKTFLGDEEGGNLDNKELNDLKNENQTLKQSIDNLISENQKFKEDILNLKEKIDNLEAQNQNLKNELAKKEEEIKRLKQNNKLKELYEKLNTKDKLKFIIFDTSNEAIFGAIYKNLESFWDYTFSLLKEENDDFLIAREMLYYVLDKVKDYSYEEDEFEEISSKFNDSILLKGIKKNNKIIKKAIKNG